MSDHGQSTSSSQTAKNADKKGNGSKVLIIILLVLVLAALGVIIYLLLKPDSTPEKEPGNRGTVLTEENLSEIIDPEPVTDAYFEASQSIDWHFKGTTSEDAYVANKATNSRTVYFDMQLKNSNETIYSSPYIPLGSELKGLTLDKELNPGTYDVILVYHLVDDNENEVSSVNVGLTIYVE